MANTAQLPGLGDASGDGQPNPQEEHSVPEADAHRQPLEVEERFGVPKGDGSFFRIDATSGRSFAVWAGSEGMALAAVEWIDRFTVATGRETFRIAAVPVRLEGGAAGSGGIAKVREIKS